MNEVQINEGVTSLTQREKEISSSVINGLRVCRKRLSDVTLCVAARMYAKELKNK